MDINKTMTQQEQDEAIRNARREYARQYRARNRDKVQQWNRAYWLRRAQREAMKQGGADHGA